MARYVLNYLRNKLGKRLGKKVRLMFLRLIANQRSQAKFIGSRYLPRHSSVACVKNKRTYYVPDYYIPCRQDKNFF
jgi:hypothetical protein